MLDPWTPLTERESWPAAQDTHYERSRTLCMAWVRLMQALTITQRTIREMVVTPARNRDGIVTDLFAERLGYGQITSRIFASLTRLQLALDVRKDPMLSGIQLEEGRFADMLSTAINLVQLHIKSQWPWDQHAIYEVAPLRTHFYAIFKGCHFPKLNILRLEGLSAKPEQLLRFLRLHQCLLDFAFHNYGHGLKGLELLVPEIRNTTCVRIFRLDWFDWWNFIEMPSRENKTYTKCNIHGYCKTFARDGASCLHLYGN